MLLVVECVDAVSMSSLGRFAMLRITERAFIDCLWFSRKSEHLIYYDVQSSPSPVVHQRQICTDSL